MKNNDLQLLEVTSAEKAANNILEELEKREFYTNDPQDSAGLKESIIDIILEQFAPHLLCKREGLQTTFFDDLFDSPNFQNEIT